MSQKQVMPKSEDLSRSLEINAIWTFDTEFPTIFNKSCTYITFKSAVKHRQLGYGYPRGQTVHLAEIYRATGYYLFLIMGNFVPFFLPIRKKSSTYNTGQKSFIFGLKSPQRA